MKKQILLVFSLFALIMLSSCEKEETFDSQWKDGNEAQFTAISNNSEYMKLNSESGKGYIMYKVIESGTGDKPYFTSTVKVLYQGWYKSDWTKPDTYTDAQGNVINNKRIFDSTDRIDIPATFTVNGLIDGFSTALQNMRVGDKWEIWIPWWLGYGESNSGSIRAYSTLAFEVELVAISKK